MFKDISTAALLTAFAIVTPAFAQMPTEAQREAIKSDCRSDYIAHCASIPPGGEASLQCLQKNMASLSGACATAVRAVEVPANAAAAPQSAPAPKQETKTEPAATTPETATPSAASPAAAPAAKPASAARGQPSSAQIAAIKSNCRSDYPKVCASVPPGGAAALECLEKNKARLSAACGKAVAAAGAGGAAPAAAAAPASGTASPAAAAAAPAPLLLRRLLPREELFVTRSACSVDIRTLCAGVAPGGGRIVQCLASQATSLSPNCRGVLARFASQ